MLKAREILSVKGLEKASEKRGGRVGI